ncbi:hypothetical protein C0J45_6329 [Silurus meridionalis]|nr:hypothetical protein C0J45_6329 [Silurus meridionalis]
MFSSPRLWWKKNKYEYIPPSEPLPSTGSDTKTPREPSGTSEKFTGKGKDEAKKVFKWDFRKKNLVDSPADSNKNKENSVAASLGVAQDKLYEKTNEFRKSVEDGNACRLPNLGKTCYCNASLQFLFTANAFCRELSDIIDNYNDRLEVQFIRCSFEEDQFKFFHYIIVPLFHKSLDLCLSKALSVRLKGRSFDTIAEIQLVSQKVLDKKTSRTRSRSGHFVTDCISPNPPQWVNYNDEDVTLTTEEDVLKERSTCASVFLYEKVSTDETILLNG